MVKRQDASTGEIVEVKDGAQPQSVKKPKDDLKDLRLHIKVYSPFKTYFDDEALSISAENDTGPFDVLPKHHNFMSLLNPCDLIIRLPSKEQRIRITRGIMHVRKDRVTVFLDV